MYIEIPANADFRNPYMTQMIPFGQDSQVKPPPTEPTNESQPGEGERVYAYGTSSLLNILGVTTATVTLFAVLLHGLIRAGREG